MITPSVTAPVRRWPCLTHSLDSVHILDLTSHGTLPSTMLAVPFQQTFVSNPKMCALTDMIITVGPMTSRCSLTHYAHTGNIARPSPWKMALSYMEKSSSSLCQKGRGYYSNSNSSIKEPPKPSFCTWMCLLARHKQSHRRISLTA